MSEYASTSPSGEVEVVRDQVELLRSAGHRVEVLVRRTDDLSSSRWYRVQSALRVGVGVGGNPSDVLGEIDPDVVHVHNTFPNWGTRWLRHWAPKTIFSAHNYRTVCANGLLSRDRSSCRQCLAMPALPAVVHRCYRNSAVQTIPVAFGASPLGGLRALVRDSRVVICLNDVAAATLREVAKGDVVVVPNFVEAPREATPAPRSGWVYAGRLDAAKGICELLKLWPDSEHLTIAGDGPYAQRVAAAAAARPNLKVVGRVERDTLIRSLGQFEGVVVPSLIAEGLPTILLEALSRGTPLVLSDRLDVAHSMHAQGVALVFDPLGTSEAISVALSTIRDNLASIERLAEELHKRRYSPQAWLREIEPLYERVARGGAERWRR